MPAIRVKHRESSFNVEIDFERTVQDLFEYLSEVVDINGLHCKLLIGGKAYIPSSGGAVLGEILKPGGLAILMASTGAEVERVKAIRADPLVKGFDQEDLDNIRRAERAAQLENENPWGKGAIQHPEFKFDRFEVLFKRHVPPPFDAEKLLKKLATDPAIVNIMAANKFKVGTLCELDPEDADAEQASKGEGDKCLLGWNRNFGERVALRLRTDDFQSFRNYSSIVNTLIHELVHNIHGPHNDDFWKLFNKLKEEYQRFHSGRRNATTVGSEMARPSTSKSSSVGNTLPPNRPTERVPNQSKAVCIDEMRKARLKAFDKNR